MMEDTQTRMKRGPDKSALFTIRLNIWSSLFALWSFALMSYLKSTVIHSYNQVFSHNDYLTVLKSRVSINDFWAVFMGKAMYVIKSSLDATDAAAVYGCLCLRLPSRPSLLFSFLFFLSLVWSPSCLLFLLSYFQSPGLPFFFSRERFHSRKSAFFWHFFLALFIVLLLQIVLFKVLKKVQ